MASDMFMNVDGVAGEAVDDKHSDWIEILEFNHGVSQAMSATGVGSKHGGKAEFQPFTVTKPVDKATPDLMLKCIDGSTIPKIEIECCEATGDKHTYLKYTFENCGVTSLNAGGAVGNGDRVTESVGFISDKLTVEYTPIEGDKPGAAVSRTWNIATNVQE